MIHSLLVWALLALLTLPGILSVGIAETQITQAAPPPPTLYGRFNYGEIFFQTSTGAAQNCVVGTNIGFTQSVGTANVIFTLANGDLGIVFSTGAGANTLWFGQSDFGSSAVAQGWTFKRFANHIFRIVPLDVGNNSGMYIIGIFKNGASGGVTTPIFSTAAQTNYPGKYCAFLYAPLAFGGNWQCVTGTDSTHQTRVDSGIAVDATATHEFRIAYDGASTVAFYIDEALVGKIQTNLPLQTDVMSGAWGISNLNHATAFRLGVCYTQVWFN